MAENTWEVLSPEQRPDIGTALALFLLLGRQWLLLPPLISEAVPGLALLPAWVLVVASIAA